MADRLRQLKAFVEKEKNTMKSFNDPKNIEKYKWYIKESLTNMKGEMLREIDSMLQDKRFTLMRQYNNHNDSLRREITELENERKEIYNFKFNDGAIMKNAKVRSFLAQEFRDLKARLSKKSFKDNKPKSQREVWLTGLSSIKDSLKRFKDENWSEGKHKRDKDGKFSSTGNGGKSAKESNAVSKPDIKSLAKSKDKKEVKKVAKAYWTHFLNGVDDLVDWAGEDEDLRYYAEDGDIEGMAEIMANSRGGRETAIEALNDMEEDELNGVSEHINDSAEYINDRKIDIKRDGKLIDIVNAETLDEAVRIYERQHPELRGQIDAYFSDARFDPLEELGEQYDMGLQSKHLMVSLLKQKYGMTHSQAKEAVEQFAREVKEMGLPIRDSKINFNKSWAERMFEAGYTARETAMKIDEYTTSTDIRAQKDLIAELEHLRNVYFENKRNAKRAGR